MSDFLQHHGLQHARPPCPSPTPRVYPNSCPLSWWWHPIISSSVVPFFSCFQPFPEAESFSVSQLFISCGQSIRVSASVSVFPVNIQGWSSLRLTGLISLLLSITVRRHQFFGLLYGPALTTIPDHWEDHCLDIRTFVGRVMSLLFNILSLSSLSCQEAIAFWFHGCSHCPQWF